MDIPNAQDSIYTPIVSPIQDNNQYRCIVTAVVLEHIRSSVTSAIATLTYKRKISTIAGSGTTVVADVINGGFIGDGGIATSAQINTPYHIAVDTSSNIYFTDFANRRIRKIDSNNTISTIVGTGVFAGGCNTARYWFYFRYCD